MTGAITSAALRDLLNLLGGNRQEFLADLREHPEQLSFATALEAELGIAITVLE